MFLNENVLPVIFPYCYEFESNRYSQYNLIANNIRWFGQVRSNHSNASRPKMIVVTCSGLIIICTIWAVDTIWRPSSSMFYFRQKKNNDTGTE